MKRDLEADLKLCEGEKARMAAEASPFGAPPDYCGHGRFAAEARGGWPWAIAELQKANAEVERLRGVLALVADVSCLLPSKIEDAIEAALEEGEHER